MEPTPAPWSGRGAAGGGAGGAPWAGRALPRRGEGAPPAALERAQEPRWPPPAGPGAPGRRVPRKRLTSEAGLQRFLESDVCAQFHGFLVHVALSARGTRQSDEVAESPVVRGLCELLEEAACWLAEVPPEPQSGRFGNKAFRDWHARLRGRSRGLLREMVLSRVGAGAGAGGSPAPPSAFAAGGGGSPSPTAAAGAAAAGPDLQVEEELAPYLEDSFGNATRLDYGSGHETNFAALLFCLARLGVLVPADGPALVMRVFSKYLELARALQRAYCLEPAGSHGVWGLDDYQFLAFLFGAAQLAGHPHIRPSSIHSVDIVETYGDQYLYLGCVRHVLAVKKGPIATTSPMLNDISGVRGGWEKVTSGLVKMFKGEVLTKLPIMQHFLFGSLLPFPEGAGAAGPGAEGGPGAQAGAPRAPAPPPPRFAP